MREDRAAVLRACVCALAVQGCRIVHAEEEEEELFVRDFGGIIVDLEGFRVYHIMPMSDSFFLVIGQKAHQE